MANVYRVNLPIESLFSKKNSNLIRCLLEDINKEFFQNSGTIRCKDNSIVLEVLRCLICVTAKPDNYFDVVMRATKLSGKTTDVIVNADNLTLRAAIDYVLDQLP